MASDVAAWLSKVQAQPWYQDVAAAFAKEGVDARLWEATLRSENASLDPTSAVYDPGPGGTPGYSYGLFQERQPGLGSGYSTATLKDPVKNAQIAAARMGAALRAKGLSAGDPLDEQLRAIELAGWNGSLEQDAQRQSVLQDITGGPLDPRFWNTGGAADAITGALHQDLAKPIVDAAHNALGFPSSEQIDAWVTNALIGAVLLGVLAGGFALLAAPAAPAALAAA